MEEETTKGFKKREVGERRKVTEDEGPKLVERRSRARERGKKKQRGKGDEDRRGDKKGGEKMRGKIEERKGRSHRRGEEMARLQRSSRFKSGPPFHGETAY